jgi:hypothetical protein
MSSTLVASAVASAVLCSAACARARMTVAAAQSPRSGAFQLKGAVRVQAGRAGVVEVQECLGEMLIEFGAVESEASRLVAAGGVHVALSGCSRAPMTVPTVGHHAAQLDAESAWRHLIDPCERVCVVELG